MQNTQGLPVPAWPIGITPEDCRIHAEAPEKEPVVEQEPYQEPLVRRLAQYKLQQAKERKQASKGQSSSSVAIETSQYQVQDQEVMEEEVPTPPMFIRRESERIKQIKFLRPPSPGPGLTPDDAISLE